MAFNPNENIDQEEEGRHVLETEDVNIARKESPNLSQESLQTVSKSSSGNGLQGKAIGSSKDRFCEICSQVAFDAIFKSVCMSCIPTGFKAQGLIQLATVETILVNEACPACRLIASLIQSYPDRVPQAAMVNIIPCSNSMEIRENGRDKGTIEDIPASSSGWIEVEVCSHGVEGKRKKDYYVGSLLPAKEYELSRIDCQDRDENLFKIRPHGEHIFARKIPEIVDRGLMKAWMRFCEETHDSCEDRKSDIDEETRIRLIDVRKRRLVTGTLKESYLALSYVWGKNIKGVLTKDTKKLYQQEGSLVKESIPNVVFDAIELAAELGEQYLWVDTACIIQDDDRDKQRQLPIMDLIYSHAKLVIIAGTNNANSELPRWKETQHRARLHVEMLRGMRVTTGQVSLAYAMEQVVWNTRGWTFQEGLLARRKLVFTKYQVYWHCCEEIWCEDRYTEFKNIRNSSTGHDSLLKGPSVALCGNKARFIGKYCPMCEYQQRATAFSQRRFTNYDDTFWAFTGILKIMKEHFPRGYIWGLPYDDLDVAILWQADCAKDCNSAHAIYDGCGVPHRYPIPSWCWLSKGCYVKYDTGGGSVVSLVKWHKPLRYPNDCNWSVGCCKCFISESSISVGAQVDRIEPGSAIFDFGLLHFTAQAAKLRLQEVAIEGERTVADHWLVPVHILLSSGKVIGEIRVPKRILSDGRAEQREFISLSQQTYEERSVPPEHEHGQDDGPHIPGCQYFPNLNIMLIQWGGHNDRFSFATRVALRRIELSAWEEVGAIEKDILLT